MSKRKHPIQCGTCQKWTNVRNDAKHFTCRHCGQYWSVTWRDKLPDVAGWWRRLRRTVARLWRMAGGDTSKWEY